MFVENMTTGDLAINAFFRHNSDCAREVTALAVASVPLLMTNTKSFPDEIQTTLLMTLQDKALTVCVH